MNKTHVLVLCFFIAFSGFFPTRALAQVEPCPGANTISDGICSSLPRDAGALVGAAAGVSKRLNTLLGASSGASINAFVRTFDNSPTSVQRFALQTIVPMIAEGSGGAADFDAGNLRSFTSALRSIGLEFNRGFDDISCPGGLGASSVEGYTDYSQAFFLNSLSSMDPQDFIGGRINAGNLRRAAIDDFCERISAPLP